jgi:hypothetical protein
MNWSATSANWWNRRWAASLASWRLAELRMLAAASCRAYTVLLLTDASAHRVCNHMRASGLRCASSSLPANNYLTPTRSATSIECMLASSGVAKHRQVE